jgi:hypothetical protein
VKVPALLALAGFLLIVGAGLLAPGAWCFMVAIIAARVRGRAAIRWAVLFVLVAVVTVVAAVLMVPASGETTLLLATSAAFGILAATQGLRAHLDEVALAREGPASSVPPATE